MDGWQIIGLIGLVFTIAGAGVTIYFGAKSGKLNIKLKDRSKKAIKQNLAVKNSPGALIQQISHQESVTGQARKEAILETNQGAMSTSKDRVAQLIKEVKNEVHDRNVSLSNVIMKCFDIAKILRRNADVFWLKTELIGLQRDAPPTNEPFKLSEKERKALQYRAIKGEIEVPTNPPKTVQADFLLFPKTISEIEGIIHQTELMKPDKITTHVSLGIPTSGPLEWLREYYGEEVTISYPIEGIVLLQEAIRQKAISFVLDVNQQH